ncbi:amino acid permease [Tsukamurella sp. 8F]|uniref:amino acid permease n=1 Tax=unclassified Tsukamurella TaxID=2633480 RepID=UPI0023B9E398|nr:MULTISPECIES: amino acid permease [unclassified Tsukamurella]MDF0528391.1 amino acid permease [Tsukamurella sp. 8J]MDF0586216.1 amino acid permease [Tsukamurella sp. 8F]
MTNTSDSVEAATESPHLSRALGNRHIQLIAIGGAIGTGLFMGSGKTISVAGPSVILVYCVIGFMLYFVMRAMGELLLSRSGYRNFSDFAGDILGPWAAHFTGWTYWFCWVVTAVADVVVISSVYVTFWLDSIPPWIPAVLVIALLIGLNLPTVKAFGETEFWFAMIKVVAIVALIVIGAVMIIAGFTHDGATASLTNLWDHGGFFPKGIAGFVAGFQIAVFAFVGIELVGTAAAETKDPEKNLPRAVNSIPVRILLFYVGSLVVLMAVVPWDRFDADQSPFVMLFSLAGLGAAAHLVNAVVLTSATSSANSGIYSTSRMVYGLATDGDAPRAFAKLSSRRVPQNALFLTGVVLLSAVVLLACGLDKSTGFTIVTTVSSLCFMFVWTVILASYLVYRSRRPQDHAVSRFRMPLGMVMPWVVFAFFVFLVWAFTQETDTLQALIVTPIWFVAVAIGYVFVRRSPRHAELRAAHATKVAEEKAAAERWRGASRVES